MYESDTWTLIKENERKLKCFERKALLKIFKPCKAPKQRKLRPRTLTKL